MAQALTPFLDISAGGWTTDAGAIVDLFAAIDEAAASDADYVQSSALAPGNSDVYDVKLSAAADPQSALAHGISYRYQALGAATMELTVALMQGATTVAQQTHSNVAVGMWLDGMLTLSGAEADSITDYSDLRLRFVAVASSAGLDFRYPSNSGYVAPIGA